MSLIRHFSVSSTSLSFGEDLNVQYEYLLYKYISYNDILTASEQLPTALTKALHFKYSVRVFDAISIQYTIISNIVKSIHLGGIHLGV